MVISCRLLSIVLHVHGDRTREPASGIQLPEKFNFSRTEDWPKRIRWFERYRQASELNKKDDTLQINTLIHAMDRYSHFFEINSG